MTDRPPLDRLDAALATLNEHAKIGTGHAYRVRLINRKRTEIRAEILLRTRRGETQA